MLFFAIKYNNFNCCGAKNLGIKSNLFSKILKSDAYK